MSTNKTFVRDGKPLDVAYEFQGNTYRRMLFSSLCCW